MEVNFYEMYLEEMALIPVLEAEEEEKVLALAATGDKEAKKRLVEGSLAKVAQMVKEYEGRELPMSDVVQEANVALTAAAAAYDGSQQWQEFLAQEIHQAVEAALEEQKTEAEIEENMTARVNVLQTVSQVMAKELGREATVAELAEKMKMTEDEVKKLYLQCQSPTHVIAHCRAVADVAVRIGAALNQKGCHFDLALLKGAGLVHDVARTQEDHGGVAADILQKLGYRDEADIIRHHMYYTLVSHMDELTECDLVCLADRLVIEDRYVGLDKRFDYILHKNENHALATETILKAKKQTRGLLDEMEAVLGCAIDSLFLAETETTER